MDSCNSPSITTRYWSNSLIIAAAASPAGSRATGGWAVRPRVPTMKAMEKARIWMEAVFKPMFQV